ncbi:MAG: hypothetical protein U0M60_19565 [Clostridia bacterium]|nr:hypothetical protein [Clostridia bacterium]
MPEFAEFKNEKLEIYSLPLDDLQNEAVVYNPAKSKILLNNCPMLTPHQPLRTQLPLKGKPNSALPSRSAVM